MASWVKGYSPGLISQALESDKRISGSGEVSFSGMGHSEYVTVLKSMVSLDQEIPEPESRKIVSKATFKAGIRGAITAKSLISEISRLERDFLTSPVKKYRLLTSISISCFCNFPNVRIEGSTIVINARLNKKSRACRNKILSDARYSINDNGPKNYLPVSVSVAARSPAEAADKALDRLDFIRGVWNLWINRQQTFRMSSGRRNPVNRIVLGPIHSLHEFDGTLATESWWFEPQYQGPINLYKDKAKVVRLLKFASNFRRHLNRSVYKKDIVNAVIRYVRALDSRDWDDAFLRLWGILEFLTGTLSDPYKVTIRRASFMYSDREFARQILSHLRDYRNRAVHAGIESNDIETFMYQLKRFVETILEFHVGNKYRFLSIADAAEVMDLPGDIDTINNRLKKLEFAKQYIL